MGRVSVRIFAKSGLFDRKFPAPYDGAGLARVQFREVQENFNFPKIDVNIFVISSY